MKSSFEPICSTIGAILAFIATACNTAIALFNTRCASIFLLFLLLFGSMNTFAGDRKWEGDVNSDWNDPNNWQDNRLPYTGDHALIQLANYINAPIVSSASAFTFSELKVYAGGVLTIQADLTFTNKLTVDGSGNSTPTVNMSGGAITIAANQVFTVKKGGIFNFTGGTINATGNLYMEDGTFNMNENDATAALNIDSDSDGNGYLEVKCNAANALFNLDAGTVTVGQYIQLNGNSKHGAFYANIDMSGGSFTNNGPTYFKSAEDDSTLINITGGTAVLTGEVRDNSSGKIDIHVSGGNLDILGVISMEAGDSVTTNGSTWDGSINNDWNNASNWGNYTVPTGTDSVVIPASATITINGNANAGNLIINSSATLSFIGSDTLKVAGDIILDGSLVTGSGKVELTSSETQYIGGSGDISLDNFVISNTSPTGVIIQQDISVTGSIPTGTNVLFYFK